MNRFTFLPHLSILKSSLGDKYISHLAWKTEALFDSRQLSPPPLEGLTTTELDMIITNLNFNAEEVLCNERNFHG